MSNEQVPSDSLTPMTPSDISATNNRNRQNASRPGWRAGLCVVAFVVGVIAYMSYI